MIVVMLMGIKHTKGLTLKKLFTARKQFNILNARWCCPKMPFAQPLRCANSTNCINHLPPPTQHQTTLINFIELSKYMFWLHCEYTPEQRFVLWRWGVCENVCVGGIHDSIQVCTFSSDRAYLMNVGSAYYIECVECICEFSSPSEYKVCLAKSKVYKHL